MPTPLHHLPEPTDLHARFSRNHRLSWGEPLPSKAEIAAESGVLATREALTRLQAISWEDEAATGDLLALTRPGVELYQLDKRVKSPQSLARKIKKHTGKRQRSPAIEDVQRYTVMTPVHDRLAELARRAAAGLQDLGWQLAAVRNSYVEGSRYKGVHLDTVDRRGRRIEVQLHSSASIWVKEATTAPYVIERDANRPRAEPELARAECIRLSAGLPMPRGLDDLTELGGCPVTVRGYGLGRDARRPPRNGAAPATDGRRAFDAAPDVRKELEL
ncbi:hypothetical protein ACWCOV_21660 [Kribbella sp. NPDC002412]